MAASTLRILRSSSRLTSVFSPAYQCRHLSLQEYQSKQLMQDYGINIQRFQIVENKGDVDKAVQGLNKQCGKVNEYVIKAQILAGGRGKGHFKESGLKGGVKLTKDSKQVADFVSKMLGYKLVTHQTPEDGVKVQRVMIAEALDIAKETYLAFLMARQKDHEGPICVYSPKGGVDIEQVSEESPEAIFTSFIDIDSGLSAEEAMKIAKKLEFEPQYLEEAKNQIMKLYNLFLKVDATQVEVNPFGQTPDGRIVCFDAKLSFDDNAQYRQEKIFQMGDTMESDPREVDAGKHNLNYIGLDGNIGCLVNGAGLAMATMDLIKLHGGEPANFLDVGGNVKENQVQEAFRILSADRKVKAILVNIFGGIVNCATIANGIINACRNIKLSIPLVVRLEGTNADEARRLLKDSNLPITAADSLEDAARKAVECLKK
ncbi:succinate--CoA ligase [GDP-forming] subunit beta, mitochondrial-like [Paramacrobiotus metropolitanus]|uniref:succinate--CoA ligase [GDP-forming] subunit beta, mitochondrial-like n=1 Tax=Paramacrobiotus metropolitanus TaxID=2943436 RepID=UPI002445743A|nr:succinate--CoA ligase [GDP-forming] subunit beta, mitochondrial-like [Paramacrobiotus metropolitanus]